MIGKKVTYVIKTSCGPSVPSRYVAFHGVMRWHNGKECFQELKVAGTIERPARFKADYYELAKEFATAEYPAFSWDKLQAIGGADRQGLNDLT